MNPVIQPLQERWYFVAISYDGNNNAAYVDGQRVGYGSPDSRPGTSTANLIIGGNPGDSRDFRGWVADFAVFERAVSAGGAKRVRGTHLPPVKVFDMRCQTSAVVMR